MSGISLYLLRQDTSMAQRDGVFIERTASEIRLVVTS